MESALEEIEKLEASLKGSLRHANQLPQLLQYTKHAHPRIAAQAMQAAARVFVYHGTPCLQAAAVPAAASDDAEAAEAAEALQTVRRFLRQRYDALVAELLQLLRTTDDDRTIVALHVLMDLLVAESTGDTGDGNGPVLPDPRLQFASFSKILEAMVDPAADKVRDTRSMKGDVNGPIAHP